MKSEQANYVIPLDKAFSFPPKKRVTKALAVVKAFVKKHTRFNELSVSMEVNEFLHLHSKNIPKRIDATLLKDGGKIIVFMREGKQLAQYQTKKEAEKKKKEQKKEEKKDSKEKKEEAEEKKQKLEDKKEKEDAAKAAGIKRGTA
ncbi:MAG TPA: hypothetical protein VJH23_00460 [archaeon]|nr:hypothetical protein [archaeon]